MNPVIRPFWLLVIQTVLVFLQLVNAQLAVLQDVPVWVTLILSAFVGALQFLTQHVGNKQDPNEKVDNT